jgi:pyruvate kinase
VIHSYLSQLTALRDDIVAAAEARREAIDSVPAPRRGSAKNLIHYLALRRHDLRELQGGLAGLGMSSLGRMESRVLPTIDAVLRMLRAWTERNGAPIVDSEAFDLGERILAEQTEMLLGPAPPGRHVRIMVTMPIEAADDYALVHQLIAEGMDCMRINCAHGDADQWRRIVGHLRRAEHALQRRCTLLMDLAGIKLRTGPVTPGPAVLKVRPTRDAYGRVTADGRVRLIPAGGGLPPGGVPALPVGGAWLAGLQPGDRLKLRDARDARRVLTVLATEAGGAWVSVPDTTYFVPGTALRRDGSGSSGDDTVIADLPERPGALHLDAGDFLLLTRDAAPGADAPRDPEGRQLMPSSIGCTLPIVLQQVRPGEAIWFDDGRIGGRIDSVTADGALVRITQAPPGGARLGADKGINLPDSAIGLPALTDKDRRDLAFVVEHADSVGLSFVNGGDDVAVLQAAIAALGPRRPSLMLKIETRRGFEHLPEIVLAAMASPCFGVMIARGDLAVECGFERLAEVQEEMLWICEAAHVPVVWATQVLEAMAKEGMPSRAEITDAAMGHRAECVMLNKGPHIVAALRTLDDILRRMEAHQSKKRAMLRELRVAHAL